MPFDIISMGPLLIELIRQEKGRTFEQPGTFCGPYASGDTPIFINAAAKMGARCGFIGSVGDDGFGRCVYDKMKRSGVDMSKILVVKGAYTGSTFVYYNEDETRKFMYHLEGSGSAVMYEDDADFTEYFKDCKWVHYTGFTMESSQRAKDVVFKTMEMLGKDTKISFDPNLRGKEDVAALCAPVVGRADLILPSMGEAGEYFGTDDDTGCRKWMDMGKMVVQKRGSKGSRLYYNGEIKDVPSFKATEVDATGAGDTFAATFLSGLIEGKAPEEAALYANVAGCFAVSAMGPMEGAVEKKTVQAFLDSGKREVVWSEWV
ncbi:MAG TPA: hypothetical protein DEB31_10715 [Clostridiales bacterium]|nr:hypothetical protein [Clostridiales bacterium]